MTLHKDVVIVGAGMIGLSLALALYKKGLQVAIVETKSTSIKILNEDRVETRVSAINHTSTIFFRKLEIWETIKSNRTSPYYQMQVWDDELEENINITAEEVSEHSLGCIVENDVITQALLEKINDADVEIFNNQKIKEIQRYQNFAKMILNDQTITTGLVVGADGVNSFIRNYFNFETKASSYDHTSIVATVELEKSHNQTAYQRFYDKGILAFLPLENENKSSIVWSVKTDYANYLMNLKKNDFEKNLTLAIDNLFGEIKLLSKKYNFNLFQRHAKSYIQDKVVLVGDAAHSMHPLAGQGANLGFKDVAALTEVLGSAFAKGRLLGHMSTLDKYQRERKFDNTKMTALMKIFKEVFESDNKYVKKVRRFGLRFVNGKNIIKKIILKQVL